MSSSPSPSLSVAIVLRLAGLGWLHKKTVLCLTDLRDQTKRGGIASRCRSEHCGLNVSTDGLSPALPLPVTNECRGPHPTPANINIGVLFAGTHVPMFWSPFSSSSSTSSTSSTNNEVYYGPDDPLLKLTQLSGLSKLSISAFLQTYCPAVFPAYRPSRWLPKYTAGASPHSPL